MSKVRVALGSYWAVIGRRLRGAGCGAPVRRSQSGRASAGEALRLPLPAALLAVTFPVRPQVLVGARIGRQEIISLFLGRRARSEERRGGKEWRWRWCARR